MIKTFLEEQFKKSFSNFINPILKHEIGEIERAVIEDFYPKESHVFQMQKISKMSKLLESAKLIKLSNSIWKVLENTDSYEIENGDMTRVNKLAKKYNRETKQTLDKIQNNEPIEAPVIIHKPDGRYSLLGGNTRLMIFRALGITPKVAIINWNE